MTQFFIPLIRQIFLAFSMGLLLYSCSMDSAEKTNSDAIRLNQIGYYPTSIKQFVLADTKASKFEVIDKNGKRILEDYLWKPEPGISLGKA